jgi:hypothetical protein
LTQPQPRAADARIMLSFQRLDVYQRAIEFLSLVYDIVDDLPRGHADRADQLTRAAESVIRNIAEGRHLKPLQDRTWRSDGMRGVA